MITANFHAVLLHVLVGLSFAFPMIMLFFKVFKITDPKQRVQLYLLALLIPFISLVAYHTVLTKQCERALLDTLCEWGIAFARFFLPFAGILFVWSLVKLVFAKIVTHRFKKRAIQSIRIENLLRISCHKLNQTQPTLLVVSQKGFMALVIGFLNPVLVVNERMAELLSDEELETVLIHELIHIQKGDCMGGWIFSLIRDMTFFNPMSTVLLRGYLVERERLCDLEVTKFYGEKHFYVATLLKIWKLLVEEKERMPRTQAAYLTGTQKEMTYRVTSLMSGDQSCSKIKRLLFLGIQGVLVISSLYVIGFIC